MPAAMSASRCVRSATARLASSTARPASIFLACAASVKFAEVMNDRRAALRCTPRRAAARLRDDEPRVRGPRIDGEAALRDVLPRRRTGRYRVGLALPQDLERRALRVIIQAAQADMRLMAWLRRRRGRLYIGTGARTRTTCTGSGWFENQNRLVLATFAITSASNGILTAESDMARCRPMPRCSPSAPCASHVREIGVPAESDRASVSKR